jgi:hypothetical protein
MQTFLDAVGSGLFDNAAAAHAGVDRKSPQRWKSEDPAFAKAYAEASVEHHRNRLETMEAELYRRAVTGVDKDVYYKGEVVGTVREYSDTLLIFGLKGEAPEKYRDRQEITGANGGPVVITVREDGNSNR